MHPTLLFEHVVHEFKDFLWVENLDLLLQSSTVDQICILEVVDQVQRQVNLNLDHFDQSMGIFRQIERQEALHEHQGARQWRLELVRDELNLVLFLRRWYLTLIILLLTVLRLNEGGTADGLALLNQCHSVLCARNN